MGRPKGSKNKTTIELENMQSKIKELEKSTNSYSETLDAFTEGFVIDLFNKDIIKTINLQTLTMWFSNPDEYMDKINTLLSYYYIVDGNVFQLYDLIFSLPRLNNYKIETIEKNDTYSDDIKKIRLMLEKKINHKELTRDLLIQLASKGTVVATWLNIKKDPYLYVFDDLKYVYPYGRVNGKMTSVIDLSWLDSMDESQREAIYGNLSPIITRKKYDIYLKDKNKIENKLIILPPETTLTARIHTLSRNQRLGVPFGTQILFDIQHKQKLKDLETAIANKIIRAIAVLKFKGKDDNDIKVKPSDKKKVFNGVRKALEQNTVSNNGITCIAIPDFATFEFPDIKNGDKVLDPDKYTSVDKDISSAMGISRVLTNGMDGNYSSAKLNLDMLYSKIGILLEKIEVVYNQLIEIILGENGYNYIFEYNKEAPIPKDKILDTLKNLQDKGYSTKYVLDMLGIDSQRYFEESIYEIEELKLREKIIPPQSTYTYNGENKDGRPNEENPTNTATITSKENDGNKQPKAGA